MDSLSVFNYEWSEESIKKFWDAIYEIGPRSTFAETGGDAVLKYLKSKIKFYEPILDYGTGSGFFIEKLLKYYKGYKISGCEYSQESVNLVNEKFKDYENFKSCFKIAGFPLSIKENYFGAIFMMEIIEHLNEDILISTLLEAKRMLKKDGLLIITTPNNEDLESKEVLCPNCGAIFHPIQHIQSFNKRKLEKLLSSIGVKPILCRELYFENYRKRTIKVILKNLYFNCTG